ncbi:GNAT family N-acetyltransferase [Hahella sp. HN01]|uniref:GNAT family N-acetyltransferase n=1 Tax=Hahella sp. HN01 TaxID=2847262 RepID=UPI001C1E9625|nr:GNAT family N-acetyltransferase [Hahella sp. HN01]MBU6953830.1 GNAT family N-acetyltransferase [Hahella sp. HN01]
MNFVLTDSPTQEDIDVIHNGLIAYNLNYMDMRDMKDLAVFYSDDQGAKLAGVVGETLGNWLKVKYLWVSESLRGKGIGGELLARAEAEAINRGCRYAVLDTFSFQALPFYEKKGYTLQFTLESYPKHNQAKHFLTKELIQSNNENA